MAARSGALSAGKNQCSASNIAAGGIDATSACSTASNSSSL
jgi:hypothetical protein